MTKVVIPVFFNEVLLLPKLTHAITPQGFEHKLALFILAISFSFFKVAT
jgi:hypothetical protein